MLAVPKSEVFFAFRFCHWNLPFTTIVEETVGNETETLLRRDVTGYHLPLYRASGTSSR